MRNVKFTVKGTTLLIECDLSQPGVTSKVGKSLVIASTQGNADIGEGVKVGLNVYVTNPAYVAPVEGVTVVQAPPAGWIPGTPIAPAK